MKKLGRRAPALGQTTMVDVARGLFPPPPATNWERIPVVSTTMLAMVNMSDIPLSVPSFVTEEFARAVANHPSGKAPGPDFVLNESNKLAFRRFPSIFVECFNAYLAHGEFPTDWK